MPSTEDDYEAKIEEERLNKFNEEQSKDETPRIGATWKLGYFIDQLGCIRRGFITIDDNKNKQDSTIVCEGYVYIDREIKSISDNKNKLILKVKPLHKDEMEIEIEASDLADSRKLQKILCNEFGSDDLGALNVKLIKYCTFQVSPKFLLFILS
jgi:hypothetical protein